MKPRSFLPTLLACLLAAQAAERPVPAPGVPVPEADRVALEAGLRQLQASIEKLNTRHAPKSLLVADVKIYAEAVRYALRYNEFLKPEEIQRGKELLRQGQERADQLLSGRAPWAVQSGLVVRGYPSRIDDSVQPYGLVIPSSWSPGSPHRWRLDAWFHGRNESLTELNFIHDRQTNAGQFTPPDTIVLHLYGRYCNANKFAGEVDLFEALDAVKQHYRIDPDRINVRGFSMGGAATWHIAAHHAGLWASAAPGAGFAETAEFLKVFQNETVQPAWWEQKLWRMYDATAYALNFFNLPVVAYSGEKDRQIQAAQVMERELAKEGITLRHIIGPDTQHRYHPDSKMIIDRHIDAITARGRDPYPRRIKFVTYTLAYNRMKWLQVDGLEQHWEQARVDAEITGSRRVAVRTRNVSLLTLEFGPGGCPLDVDAKATISIDGSAVTVPGPLSDRSWRVTLAKSGGAWRIAGAKDSEGLRKRHGLQGPIDHAFMDRFVMVKPTGPPMFPQTHGWVRAEMERAITEWRRHFRGEPIVKNDEEVNADDILNANLILWGDPSSNKVLGRVTAKLPAGWSAGAVSIGGESFPADVHVPVFIYPNPLNPNRYVVVNSGFTFREYDYLNNARQVPKLPDYAIVDTRTPPDSRWPGKIAHAGFFDESWEAPKKPPAATQRRKP